MAQTLRRLRQRAHDLGRIGSSSLALLGGLAFVVTLAVVAPAQAAEPSNNVGTIDGQGGPVEGPPVSTSPSGHVNPAPLNLARFVVVIPTGLATAYSGSVSLQFGGIHTWGFLTAGYQFNFADGARTLVPGQYDTSVDAQVSMSNDPRCGASGRGGFEIDQAVYDASGALTNAAVRFDFVCSDGTRAFGTIAYQMQNTTPNQGYYTYDHDGDVRGFGNDNYLAYLGTPFTSELHASIVHMVPTPDGNGYWMLSSDGGVFAYGDAQFSGSLGGRRLNAPVVGMASTADGAGYWVVAADGGVFAFGDAAFHGSMGGQRLNGPIVGMAADPGGGYWLVASDGGIFGYGGAGFFGSTGSMHLNRPVVGMAATGDGKGYWFVASDGGVFAYGDAKFFGSAGGLTLAQPVVGMRGTGDGLGYWLVATDGGVFSYGDAPFNGSLGGTGASQVAGMA